MNQKENSFRSMFMGCGGVIVAAVAVGFAVVVGGLIAFSYLFDSLSDYSKEMREREQQRQVQDDEPEQPMGNPRRTGANPIDTERRTGAQPMGETSEGTGTGVSDSDSVGSTPNGTKPANGDDGE